MQSTGPLQQPIIPKPLMPLGVEHSLEETTGNIYKLFLNL